MAQIPVVSERKYDGGEKLIRLLVAGGMDIVGACWAQTSDYGKAYLFLVVPAADGADTGPFWTRVWEAVKALDAAKGWAHWLERVDSSDVMVIGPGDKVGQALARDYKYYLSDGPALKSGWLGNSVALEAGAAFIYPQDLFAPPVPAAAAAGA